MITRKKWIVGVLSLFLTLILANFAIGPSGLLSSAIVPKIECGDDTGVVGCNQAETDNVLEHWFISDAVPAWISWLLVFSAGAAVLVIMIGGAMILLNFGDEDLIGKGKKTIIVAIIGLAVAMFAYFIVRVIENLSLAT